MEQIKDTIGPTKSSPRPISGPEGSPTHVWTAVPPGLEEEII